MVNYVSQEVVVLHDQRVGLDTQVEAQAALVPFAARLHAELHDALAHRRLIAKARNVTDGIDHWRDLSSRVG
jgi:hypothetical protein